MMTYSAVSLFGSPAMQTIPAKDGCCPVGRGSVRDQGPSLSFVCLLARSAATREPPDCAQCLIEIEVWRAAFR